MDGTNEQVKIISGLDFDITRIPKTLETMEDHFNKSMKSMEQNIESHMKNISGLLNSYQNNANSALNSTVNINTSNAINQVKTLGNEVDNLTKKLSKADIINRKIIDERTMQEVGNRQVLAYQVINPNVKKYYQQMATELMNDLNSGVKASTYNNNVPGVGHVGGGTKRINSETINKILDETGTSYKQLEESLAKIMKGEKIKNQALVKRLELYMNENLSSGYTDFSGNKVPPNQDYINVKNNVQNMDNVKQNTIYKPSTLGNIDYDDIQKRIADINKAAQSQAKVTFETFTNTKNLKKATIEYTDQFGMSVKEIMGWKQSIDKVTNTVQHIFKGTSFVFGDDITKAQKQIYDGLKNIESEWLKLKKSAIGVTANSEEAELIKEKLNSLNAQKQALDKKVNSTPYLKNASMDEAIAEKHFQNIMQLNVDEEKHKIELAKKTDKEILAAQKKFYSELNDLEKAYFENKKNSIGVENENEAALIEKQLNKITSQFMQANNNLTLNPNLKNDKLESDLWDTQINNATKLNILQDKYNAKIATEIESKRESAEISERERIKANQQKQNNAINKNQDLQYKQYQQSMKDLPKLEAAIANLQRNIRVNGLSDEYGQAALLLRQQVTSLNEIYQSTGKISLQQAQDVELSRQKLSILESQVKVQVASKTTSISKMIAETAELEKNIIKNGLGSEYSSQAASLKETLRLYGKKLNIAGELDEQEKANTEQLKRQLALLKDQVRITEAEKKPKSALENRVETAVSYGSIYALAEAGRQAITTIADVEKGITEIARVIEDNNFNFENFRDTLLQMGVDFGANFADVQDISLRWAQAGYNVNDTLKLTKLSLLGLNTAELNAQKSTEGFISIMAQWGLTADQLPPILDKINKVADDFSITSEDIVDGLAASSGISKQFGLDIEQTIGILTALRESSGRTGKEVGNAWKSILSYIQRPKAIDVMESLGINMFEDEARTKFRNIMDIMSELSTKWNDPKISSGLKDGFVQAAQEAGLFNEELAASMGVGEEYADMITKVTNEQSKFNDIEKRDAAQAAAGVYRRNYLIGLLEKFSTVQKALVTQNEAEGYSMEENARTVQTLTNRFNSMLTSLKQLAIAAGDAGMINILKGLTEMTIDLIHGFNALPEPMKEAISLLAIMMLTAKAAQITMKTLGIQAAMQAASQSFMAAYKSVGFLNAGMVTLKTLSAGVWTAIKSNAPLLVFTLLVAAVVKLTDHFKKLKEEQDNLLKNSKQDMQQINNTQALITNYVELTKETKSNKAAHEELLSVQRKLAELYPDLADSIDEEGNKLVTNIDLVRELNELKRDELQLKMLELAQDAPQKLKKLAREEAELRDKIAANKKRLETGDTKEKYIYHGENFEHDVTKDLIHNTAKYTDKLAENRIEQLRWQLALNESQKIIDNNTREEIKNNVVNAKSTADRAKAIEKLLAQGVTQETINKLYTESKNAMALDTSARNLNAQAIEVQTKTLAQLQAAEEEFKNLIGENLSSFQEYTDMIKEIDSKEGLGSNSIINILKNHQDLIPLLADENELRKELNNRVEQEESTVKKAYIEKVNKSNEYYTLLLGNNSKLVDNLNNAYNVDLKNYANLAEAKEKIDLQFLKDASERWAEFYDIASDTLKAPEGTLGLGNVDSEYNKITTAVTKLRSFNSSLDNIATGVKFEKLFADMSGGKDGGGDTEKEIYKAKIDRYLQLTTTIQDINNALEANKIAQQSATDIEKLALIQKEQEIIGKLITAKNAIIKEYDVEKGEIKNKLIASGFTFLNDDITNYKEKLAGLSGDDAKNAEQWVEDYVNLVHDKIPTAQNDISNLKGEIYQLGKSEVEVSKQLQEEQSKTLDKWVKDLEKAVDDRIKAIDKELEAKTKAQQDIIDSIDKETQALERQDKALDHNAKVSDLQEKIKYESMRTGIEHEEKIKEYQKQLEEENTDYAKELHKQANDDKKEAAQKEISRLKEDTDNQKKLLNDNLTTFKSLFENANGEIISGAMAMSTAYAKAINSALENQKKLLTSGKIDVDTGSISLPGVSGTNLSADTMTQIKSIINSIIGYKGQYEEASKKSNIPGMKSAADAAKSYYDQLSKWDIGKLYATQLKGLSYDQAKEYFANATFHNGGMNDREGLALLKANEIVLNPELSFIFKDFVTALRKSGGNSQTNNTTNNKTTGPTQDIQHIDKLVNIEHAEFAQPVDVRRIQNEAAWVARTFKKSR